MNISAYRGRVRHSVHEYSEELITVPGMSYTPRQLLTRFTNGTMKPEQLDRSVNGAQISTGAYDLQSQLDYVDRHGDVHAALDRIREEQEAEAVEEPAVVTPAAGSPTGEPAASNE